MEIYIKEENIDVDKVEELRILIDKLLDDKNIRYTNNTKATFNELISFQTIPIRNGIISMEWDNGSIYINNYEDAIAVLNRAYEKSKYFMEIKAAKDDELFMIRTTQCQEDFEHIDSVFKSII